jgi:DNA invertase Pin-like site-specific DNA recombinase
VFELLGRYTPVNKPTASNGRACSYTRFSTLEQTHGDSYRRRIEAAQSYADNNGLQLDTTLYIDRGVSALKGKNATEGALSAFLDAIDNGNVVIGSTLEIEHLDRLSRGHVLRALRLFSFFIEKRD